MTEIGAEKTAGSLNVTQRSQMRRILPKNILNYNNNVQQGQNLSKSK